MQIGGIRRGKQRGLHKLHSTEQERRQRTSQEREPEDENAKISSIQDEHRALALKMQNNHIRGLLVRKYPRTSHEIRTLMPETMSSTEVGNLERHAESDEEEETKRVVFCVSSDAYRSIEGLDKCSGFSSLVKTLNSRKQDYSATFASAEDTEIPSLARRLARVASHKRPILLEDLNREADLTIGSLCAYLLVATSEHNVG